MHLISERPPQLFKDRVKAVFKLYPTCQLSSFVITKPSTKAIVSRLSVSKFKERKADNIDIINLTYGHFVSPCLIMINDLAEWEKEFRVWDDPRWAAICDHYSRVEFKIMHFH